MLSLTAHESQKENRKITSEKLLLPLILLSESQKENRKWSWLSLTHTVKYATNLKKRIERCSLVRAVRWLRIRESQKENRKRGLRYRSPTIAHRRNLKKRIESLLWKTATTGSTTSMNLKKRIESYHGGSIIFDFHWRRISKRELKDYFAPEVVRELRLPLNLKKRIESIHTLGILLLRLCSWISKRELKVIE